MGGRQMMRWYGGMVWCTLSGWRFLELIPFLLATCLWGSTCSHKIYLSWIRDVYALELLILAE